MTSPGWSPTRTRPSARSPPRTGPSTAPWSRCRRRSGRPTPRSSTSGSPSTTSTRWSTPRRPRPRNLAPFLRQLRPVVKKSVPVFRDLRRAVDRKGKSNDLADAAADLAPLEARASTAIPATVAAMQEGDDELQFFRPYAPDIAAIFSGLTRAAGYYDADGHYIRAAPDGHGHLPPHGRRRTEPRSDPGLRDLRRLRPLRDPQQPGLPPLPRRRHAADRRQQPLQRPAVPAQPVGAPATQATVTPATCSPDHETDPRHTGPSSRSASDRPAGRARGGAAAAPTRSAGSSTTAPSWSTARRSGSPGRPWGR